MVLMISLVLSAAFAVSPCTTSPPPDDSIWSAVDAYGFELGDFTGDGIDDVVVIRAGRNVDLYAGGPLGLTFVVTVTVPQGFDAYTTADMDADGMTDLVLHNGWQGDEVGLFRSTGTDFQLAWVLPVAEPIHNALQVGDVNGDGFTDMGFLMDASGGQRLWVFESDPVASPTAPSIDMPLLLADTNTARWAGDIDADGAFDLVSQADGGTVVLATGERLPLDRHPDSGWVRSLKPVGDLDADGLQDIVLFGGGLSGEDAWLEVHLLRRPGLSERVTALELSTDYAATRLEALGDRDGDGTPEVAMSWQRQQYDYTGYTGWLFEGELEVWEVGASAATVEEAIVSTSRCGVDYPLPAGDVSGDGGVDLIAGLGAPVGQRWSILTWLGPTPPPAGDTGDTGHTGGSGGTGDTGRPSLTGHTADTNDSALIEETAASDTAPAEDTGTAAPDGDGDGDDETSAGCGCSQPGSGLGFAGGWGVFARR